MPVKIRLQRHGRKKRPFYHIVVADSRSKRDGRFIERIGDYNPMTTPATINLDVDKAVDWMQKGAQPTDTARAILGFKGAMYKKHLMRGVRKGAFSLEVAQVKFNEWMEAKGKQMEARIAKLADDKRKADADKTAAEKAWREEKYAPAAEEAPAEETAEATDAEAPVENAEAAPAEETAEAPAEEATETPAEETAEAPAEEAKAEEDKAADA